MAMLILAFLFNFTYNTNSMKKNIFTPIFKKTGLSLYILICFLVFNDFISHAQLNAWNCKIQSEYIPDMNMYGRASCQISNGQFIVMEQDSQRRINVIKLSGSGQLLSSKKISIDSMLINSSNYVGGLLPSLITVQSIDNTIYAALSLSISGFSSGFSYGLILKLDQNLNILNQKAFSSNQATGTGQIEPILLDFKLSKHKRLQALCINVSDPALPDAVLYSLDTSLNILWTKLIDLSNDQTQPYSLALDDEGSSYIVAGHNFTHQLQIIKVDSSGALKYYRAFGNNLNAFTNYKSAINSNTHELCVASQAFFDSSMITIIMPYYQIFDTDSGLFKSSHYYQNPISYLPTLTGPILKDVISYDSSWMFSVVLNNTLSPKGENNHIGLFKTNQQGNVMFNQFYNPEIYNTEGVDHLIKTNDGGCAILGSSYELNTHYLNVLKFNSKSEFKCLDTSLNYIHHNDPMPLAFSSNVSVNLTSFSNPVSSSILPYNTSSVIDCEIAPLTVANYQHTSSIANVIQNEAGLQIQLNGKQATQIELYNLPGEKVYHVIQKKSTELHPVHFSPGVYLLVIQNNQGRMVKKIYCNGK